MRTWKGGGKINLQMRGKQFYSSLQWKFHFDCLFVPVSPQSDDFMDCRCGHYRTEQNTK